MPEVADLNADNVAPVAPAILDAVLAANRDAAPPYGADRWTARLDRAYAQLLDRRTADADTHAFAVGSGVAANALGLAALTDPGRPIFCHQHAHCLVSEHGAPQLFTGCPLVPIADDGVGRIAPEALSEAIDAHRGDVAGGSLTLTNLTEAGTVYLPEELALLCDLAHRSGLRVHLDGARLAHAAVAIAGGVERAREALGALTWRSGVEAVSLGTAKNGGMDADAVVLFDAPTARRFRSLRDRAAQRPSKMRFLAAQLLAYADGDEWAVRALRANRLAAELAAAIEQRAPQIEIVRPVEANHVFVRLDEPASRRLRDSDYTPYEWSQFGPRCFRLVTNWATPADHVSAFAEVVAPD